MAESNNNGDKGKRKVVFPSNPDIPPLSPAEMKKYQDLADSLRKTMIEIKSQNQKSEQSNAKQKTKEEESSQPSQIILPHEEREKREMMHRAIAEEDNMTRKAEAKWPVYMFEERMKKLDAEIAAQKLKLEAAEIEASKRTRECVKCLTEEKSIMFLPCAHHLLCIKCSDVDEQKGVNECPTCRTRIVKRIALPFVPSKKE